MDLGLKGRAAVVAGGTRGVGRATAELLAAEGARVAVLARTPSHLREAEDELLAAGAEDAIGLECDLLDTGEVEAAFTFLDERWGECHALVNTVGPAHVGGLDDLTDAAWLDEFDLGVLTMIRTTRAALPLLRKATFARIVNVAASSIRHQSPGLIGFTAAKAAMASASKNLSRALAPEGIIVNTVAPGTVMSPTLAGYLVGTDLEGLPEGPLEAAYEAIARDYGASNDIGRVGLPEEVATMVVFLCSELCSFVVGATDARRRRHRLLLSALGVDGVQPRRPLGARRRRDPRPRGHGVRRPPPHLRRRPTSAPTGSRTTSPGSASARATTSRSTCTTAPSTSRACSRRSSCARCRST